MKKSIILKLVFLLLSMQSSLGQSGEMGAEDIALVKKSKTYFVLDEEDSTLYNKSMRAAAVNFWKQTPFDFIKYSQLQEYVKKPNTTFVMKLIFAVNTGSASGNWSYGFNPQNHKFEKGFSNTSPGLSYRYDAIVLVSGDRKKAEFSWKDWLAYSLVHDVNKVETYDFKLASYLQIIQNFITYIDKSGEKNVSFKREKERFNSNKGTLITKTLLINKAELPDKINTLAQIKEAYKYDVKLVTPTEIKQAIDKQDEQIVILNNVYTGNRYYPYFFEAKGGNIIYLDMDGNYIINPTKSIKKLLAEVSTQ